MGRMNEATKDVPARMIVIPKATAFGAGCPNVLPIVFAKALDDSTLLIADTATRARDVP